MHDMKRTIMYYMGLGNTRHEARVYDGTARGDDTRTILAAAM